MTKNGYPLKEGFVGVCIGHYIVEMMYHLGHRLSGRGITGSAFSHSDSVLACPYA